MPAAHARTQPRVVILRHNSALVTLLNSIEREHSPTKQCDNKNHSIDLFVRPQVGGLDPMAMPQVLQVSCIQHILLTHSGKANTLVVFGYATKSTTVVVEAIDYNVTSDYAIMRVLARAAAEAATACQHQVAVGISALAANFPIAGTQLRYRSSNAILSLTSHPMTIDATRGHRRY